METTPQVPQSWVTTTLAELGTWSSGGTPSRKNPEYYEGAIPWVKTGDLRDGPVREIEETISDVGLANSSAKLFPPETLLIAMYGATIGRLGILQQEAATNQACAALLPHGQTRELIPWVYFYLLSQRDALKAAGKGGAQPNISQEILKCYSCPLPPLNEQRRIVAKIEELTARSRRAREALEAVPALLDRFRQSVLAAAFRGDLTAEWRASRGLSDKPYRKAALRDLVREPLRNGKSVKDGDGPKVLRLSGLRNGTIDWTEAKSGDWDGIDIERFLIEDGDFLVARGNGSKGLVGRGGLVSGPPPIMAFPDTMIRVRPNTGRIHPRFLRLFWDSADARQHIEYVARTSAGIWKVSQPDLEALLIPVPNLAEQEEITRRAAELLGLTEILDARCDSARADIGRLSESVLAKAFRGELVPQDPNDEPASVLLERIRGESAELVVPKAKRGRKPRELAEQT